jgi:hypothetical protein
MRSGLRRNSLGLFFGAIFLLALVGQAVAGWKQFNQDQAAEQLARVTLPDYLGSAGFAVDVAENWQSEYLQFLLYILATVWLVQVGSTESKEPDDAGLEDPEEQRVGSYADPTSPAWARAGGLRTLVFSWSLTLVMGGVFLVSWFAQSVAGWAAVNETRLQRLQDPITWPRYLVDADFWSRTLQNWQSEFLAVGSMAVFSVFLRQRGSSESKPVGAPHSATGVDG